MTAISTTTPSTGVAPVRECALCGVAFASRCSFHRFCSDTCKAEGHHLRRILEGRGRRYGSVAERLAAATAPDAAVTRLLEGAERRAADRERAIVSGDAAGPQRGGVARWAA